MQTCVLMLMFQPVNKRQANNDKVGDEIPKMFVIVCRIDWAYR